MNYTPYTPYQPVERFFTMLPHPYLRRKLRGYSIFSDPAPFRNIYSGYIFGVKIIPPGTESTPFKSSNSFHTFINKLLDAHKCESWYFTDECYGSDYYYGIILTPITKHLITGNCLIKLINLI